MECIIGLQIILEVQTTVSKFASFNKLDRLRSNNKIIHECDKIAVVDIGIGYNIQIRRDIYIAQTNIVNVVFQTRLEIGNLIFNVPIGCTRQIKGGYGSSELIFEVNSWSCNIFNQNEITLEDLRTIPSSIFIPKIIN